MMKKLMIVAILAVLMVSSVSAKVKVRLAGYKSTVLTVDEINNTYETVDTWLEALITEATASKSVLYLTNDLKALSREHREAMIELVKDNPDKILLTNYQNGTDLLVYHNGEIHFFRIYPGEEK